MVRKNSLNRYRERAHRAFPGGADLHVHSILSDGEQEPLEVLKDAVKLGISHLAFTEHNVLHTDCEELSLKSGIEVISGCEFSTHFLWKGKRKEKHINGLYLVQGYPKIDAILEQSRNVNRKEYILEHLRQLQALGLAMTEDGTLDLDKAYEELMAESMKFGHPGRVAIACRMEKLGYCTREEAFQIYLGHGEGEEGRVEVDGTNYLVYPMLADTVQAIRSCKGALACLNHPLDDLTPGQETEELRALIEEFKAAGGQLMEVYYGNGSHCYNEEQRRYLAGLCKEYGLIPSVGSDHHNERMPLVKGSIRMFEQIRAEHERLLSEEEE